MADSKKVVGFKRFSELKGKSKIEEIDPSLPVSPETDGDRPMNPNLSKDSNKVEVESVNINTLIEQINEKINFMKVDCEGSELGLFKTISEKNLKNIDKLVIETHGDEIDKFDYDSIISNNFRVYRHNNILFAVNEN